MPVLSERLVHATLATVGLMAQGHGLGDRLAGLVRAELAVPRRRRRRPALRRRRALRRFTIS